MKRGFTVVEILITLAVMAVLLGLGVVSMRSVLVNGRDSERKADINVIALSLEAYYRNGNPTVSASYITKGTYPGVVEFRQMNGADGCSDSLLSSAFSPCSGVRFGTVLPGISDAALSAPDVPTGTRSFYVQGESGTTTASEVSTKLNQGYYIYKPLSAAGSTSECAGINDISAMASLCRAFILSYKEESSGAIIQVKSRHN